MKKTFLARITPNEWLAMVLVAGGIGLGVYFPFDNEKQYKKIISDTEINKEQRKDGIPIFLVTAGLIFVLTEEYIKYDRRRKNKETYKILDAMKEIRLRNEKEFIH